VVGEDVVVPAIRVLVCAALLFFDAPRIEFFFSPPSPVLSRPWTSEKSLQDKKHCEVRSRAASVSLPLEHRSLEILFPVNREHVFLRLLFTDTVFAVEGLRTPFLPDTLFDLPPTVDALLVLLS